MPSSTWRRQNSGNLYVFRREPEASASTGSRSDATATEEARAPPLAFDWKSMLLKSGRMMLIPHLQLLLPVRQHLQRVAANVDEIGDSIPL